MPARHDLLPVIEGYIAEHPDEEPVAIALGMLNDGAIETSDQVDVAREADRLIKRAAARPTPQVRKVAARES